MPNFQRVEIMGHLGQDPDVRDAAQTRVATISVATTDRKKDESGAWVDGHTEWHRVVCWERLAETCATLHKGDAVLVIGKLKTRKWTDAQDVERYTTEIIARELHQLVYQRRDGARPPHPAQATQDEYDIGELGPPLDMDSNPLSPGD